MGERKTAGKSAEATDEAIPGRSFTTSYEEARRYAGRNGKVVTATVDEAEWQAAVARGADNVEGTTPSPITSRLAPAGGGEGGVVPAPVARGAREVTRREHDRMGRDMDLGERDFWDNWDDLNAGTREQGFSRKGWKPKKSDRIDHVHISPTYQGFVASWYQRWAKRNKKVKARNLEDRIDLDKESRGEWR